MSADVARAVQKPIRSPECGHGAQDTGDPGRKQVLQNARIVFFGGTGGLAPWARRGGVVKVGRLAPRRGEGLCE